MAKNFKDIIDELKAQGSTLIADIEAQSKTLTTDFLAGLKGASPTVEEQEDIAWATTAMTASKVLAVGATPDVVAALDQADADAKSILANIAAGKAHDAQALVQQTEQKVLGIVQAVVMRGEQLLIGAALAALV